MGIVRPEIFLDDGECTPHQWLGLEQSISGLKQLGKITEAECHSGMVERLATFGNGQSASVQRLRFGI